MQFSAFPVVVGVGDTLHQNVLLWAGDNATQLWGSDEARQPVHLLTGPPVVARHRIRGRLADEHILKYEVELSDGERWQVALGTNCGCGHPLKSFHPDETVIA